jgi:hypothetical protein
MGLINTRHVAALVVLGAVVPLAGCGGGGGGGGTPGQNILVVAATRDPPNSNTFLINPGASWKPPPSDDFYNQPLASVDLALLNNGQPVPAGRVLQVQYTGQFYYTVNGDLAVGAAGLLVNASGQFLAPGGGSTVGATSAATDCKLLNVPDTIPEDFSIPSGVVGTVVVPEGATAMRIAVSDCYYKDNSAYAADPIRVTITLQ